MIARRTVLLAGAAATLALAARSPARRERVIGGPCEGCDWVYDDLPDSLDWRARIAPRAEPGAPMIIDGVVTAADGKPAAGIIVYAYHTDRTGIYPPAGNRHGRLRGWALTDVQGRYRFETIRPGAYPSRDVAEHVHMHVIEPGVGTYYVDNLEFEDDPLQRGGRAPERGGNGLMRPVRRDGAWQARRDIVLGRNIPAYPR